MATLAAVAGLDALPSEVAVLDGDGVIRFTNEAWKRFGAENANPAPDSTGVDYLAVCEAASDDPVAAEVGVGLRELIGEVRDFYSTIYPCHSPTEQRWFALQAFGTGHGADRHVVLVHDDVTAEELEEREAGAEFERLSMLAGVLTHDLTNSLSVARGYLALLTEDIDSPYLGPLTEAVERMTAITEAAGLVARQGAVTEFDAVDVGLLARRTWLGIEPEPATIEVHEVDTIPADEGLLMLLLENLFRNAIDHGGERVHVVVGPLPDGFFVADNGPGIPPEEREEAFEAGITTANGHTGLGLAIVSRIARAHGWQVRIADGREGGTRIEVRGVAR